MRPFKKMIYMLRSDFSPLTLYSFYYVGSWSVGDGAHPEGGTLVYIDANGAEQSITGIVTEDGCVEYFANSIVSSVGLAVCVPQGSPEPQNFIYYQTEYVNCAGAACAGESNPVWIYNLSPILVLNKYYYDSISNKSYKILSNSYTYAQYVSAGSPMAVETGGAFASIAYDTCTCLVLID